MRTQSLRQAANRYLKMEHGGSFKDKKHRAFVIHKLIDDLFTIGEVPPSSLIIAFFHMWLRGNDGNDFIFWVRLIMMQLGEDTSDDTSLLFYLLSKHLLAARIKLSFSHEH